MLSSSLQVGGNCVKSLGVGPNDSLDLLVRPAIPVAKATARTPTRASTFRRDAITVSLECHAERVGRVFADRVFGIAR